MSTSTSAAPVSEQSDLLDRETTASEAKSLSEAQPAIEAEMLIEEISIDGMCGVY